MATAIAMPRLGMTMQEGTVVEWPLPPGARVEKGQTVLVIESEKAEAEVEATASGYFRHSYVEPGETVPCGALLGAITDTPDEPFDAEAFHREHDRPEPVASTPAAAPRAAAAPDAPRRAGAAPVAPAARALAKKLGVDATQVPGSGPGGRILKQDVEAWAERRRQLVPVADGVSLEIPSQGDGDLVLLLPGFGTDVAAFARQIPPLAEHLRVLGVNPRGVGLSDAPAQDCYDVATAAADAAASAGAPAHVVGASLGAAVAIELALAQPERVRSLTLITPFVEAGPRLLAVIDAWCRLAAEAKPETLARALLPWLFSGAFLADERARERTVRGLAQIAARVPAATLERSAAGLRAWSGTRGDALGRIDVPTLVVVAAADLLTPGGKAIAKAIPGAQTVVVSDAGHAVALEAPEAVNEAIASHLMRADR
jgi:pyruvate dehydrogenase E2 component (dihydrolipoamide acetyltransferase)